MSAPDGMPGDYSATDSSDAPFVMESAGAGTVDITGAGGRYNLAPGASGQITIPIDHSQLGPAAPPATIPLLSYDEQRGVWVREGNANLVGGSYIGKVSHFSAINTDQLKVNQACLRIDATSMPANFQLQLRIPSSGGGTVTKTAAIVNTPQRFHVAYNLPTGATVELRAFDTSGPTPTPINFVQLPPANPPVSSDRLTVNTGGPQNPTSPNLPVFPYSACQASVELIPFALPAAAQSEFLTITPGGFSAPDLNFLSPANGGAVTTASQHYYDTIDPKHLRLDLADFKAVNGFGSSTGTEEHAFYANSGDLGFGRDMHCHRNGSDTACYVTNYGDRFTPDLQDFKDAVDNNGQIATVGMEYSQVENPVGGFQTKTGGGVLRVVKFYFFAHNKPSTDAAHAGQGDGLAVAADLDGFGARPVPGLCMGCHGGLLPAGTSQPTVGAPNWNTANANSADLTSRFIPFDLREYTFTAAAYNGHDKSTEQPHFKNLNQNFVLPTNPSAAATELITKWYASSATQDENVVVCGWQATSSAGCTVSSLSPNQQQTYTNVVAASCRTCHLSQAPSNKDWTKATDFASRAGIIGSFVCSAHLMPHSKVTHNLFWLSTSPHQPPIFKTFLNTVSPGSGSNC